MISRVIIVVVIVSGSVLAHRQVRDRHGVAFEVASVKPSDGLESRMRLSAPRQGTVEIIHYPLNWIVLYAYGLRQREQLIGGPEWGWSDHFSIRAIPPAGMSIDSIPSMLQLLLAERFKLRVHWETREQRIYALSLAHADGTLGHDLRHSDHDCSAFLAMGGKADQDDAPRDKEGRILCARGVALSREGLTAMIGGAPIAEFAKWLDEWVDRPVLDETGLRGNFDALIKFQPSGPWRNQAATPGNGQPENAPMIHIAVQEQLGLKLEPRSASMRMLVIDSVEHPTSD